MLLSIIRTLLKTSTVMSKPSIAFSFGVKYICKKKVDKPVA
jgi:hypothetical protein